MISTPSRSCESSNHNRDDGHDFGRGSPTGAQSSIPIMIDLGRGSLLGSGRASAPPVKRPQAGVKRALGVFPCLQRGERAGGPMYRRVCVGGGGSQGGCDKHTDEPWYVTLPMAHESCVMTVMTVMSHVQCDIPGLVACVSAPEPLQYTLYECRRAPAPRAPVPPSSIASGCSPLMALAPLAGAPCALCAPHAPSRPPLPPSLPLCAASSSGQRRSCSC